MIFRNRWHYVVGVYDGENIRMYVDGVPGPATALKDATLDGDGYVSIGGAEWDPFLGRARRLLYHPTSSEACIELKSTREGFKLHTRVTHQRGVTYSAPWLPTPALRVCRTPTR